MPVLFLISGPKWVFRPTGATQLPDKREIWHGEVRIWHGGGPLPHAKFHVYRGRNVGIQPPKLAKFGILAINLPLRGDSFALFFTKFSAFVRVYIGGI